MASRNVDVSPFRTGAAVFTPFYFQARKARIERAPTNILSCVR